MKITFNLKPIICRSKSRIWAWSEFLSSSWFFLNASRLCSKLLFCSDS